VGLSFRGSIANFADNARPASARELRDEKPERSNFKLDPAPNSNTEKKPDEWVSGDEPMTGAQASYLKTLSEKCDEPESFAPELPKPQASKRIDALKAKCRAVWHR
jgi:hypothetical protein